MSDQQPQASLHPHSSLRGTMMEGCIFQYPNWAEWRRVLSFRAFGSLPASTLQEIER